MFSKSLRLFRYAVDYFTFCDAIAAFLGIEPAVVKKLYHQLYDSDFYKLIRAKSGLKEGFLYFNMLNLTRTPLIYLICRLLRPQVVVETGVSDGFSSSFILKALQENNQGRLYSIDFPNQPGHENENKTGWLIPFDLRTRWELIIGDSKQKLPALLERVEAVDIFFHDSDHSYEHVLFELDTVWDKLAGIALVDDIHMNRAYDHFCLKKGIQSRRIYKMGIGIKEKQEDPRECHVEV